MKKLCVALTVLCNMSIAQTTAQTKPNIAVVTAEVGETALQHARPVASGGQDGLSPVSFGLTYSNIPVGCAFLSSTEGADAFVNVWRGMPTALGIWWCRYDGTDADGNIIIKKPLRVFPRTAHNLYRIFQDGKDIFLVSLKKKQILLEKWVGPDLSTAASVTQEMLPDNCFKLEQTVEWDGVRFPIKSFDVVRRDKTTIEIAILCTDGKKYDVPREKYDTQSLYDGAGIYRGILPGCGLFRMTFDNKWQVKSAPEQISVGMDIAISPSSVVCTPDAYIVTTTLGCIKYLPYDKNGATKAEYLRHADGTVHTSPFHGSIAVSIPWKDGSEGLYIGGESNIRVYHREKMGDYGPVYSDASLVLEKHAPIYGGSLTVPNVVDWDGDGALDIVAGNSEGRLLFFKNNGTNLNPDFAMSVELESDGEPIRILPGYHIVQGPLEGAWGYLCPTVFDWNGDGLLDVVVSGSIDKYMVMLNKGTKTEPKLDAPRVIRVDNMELYGTWRVRPAIARIDGEVYMLIMDDLNAVHKYRRVDDVTVEDCGRVLLTDGRIITGHSDAGESLGQMGRAKMHFCDWDGDGDLDLFIGSVKRNAYPEPHNGIPYRRFRDDKVAGMQVMLFINEGKGADFVFRQPVQMQVDGQDFYLGAHSNAPAPCMLGDTSDGPNLLVGCESGKYFFFEHKHLNGVN